MISLAVAGIGASASAEERIVEFVGDSAKITDEFEIQGPWLLDWWVTSEFVGSAGVEVDLVDGSLLSHKGVVLKAKRPGYGTKLFAESGRFRFRVTSSFAGWRLRVSKISREEAEKMIPAKDRLRN